LLRHKDKIRGRKLLDIAKFIKSNSLRLSIINDPVSQGRMSPETFGQLSSAQSEYGQYHQPAMHGYTLHHVLYTFFDASTNL
jgi:hypothetical protein